MAWPALAGPASWAAVSLAVPQKTGSISAGMKRATASIQMFEDSAARALANAKTSRIAINSFFLSKWARAAVRGGPKSMTVKANSVTSWPAAAIDTPRSRARAGSRPMIRNSVVTIKKAEMARMIMLNAEPAAGITWGRGESIARITTLLVREGVMVLIL